MYASTTDSTTLCPLIRPDEIAGARASIFVPSAMLHHDHALPGELHLDHRYQHVRIGRKAVGDRNRVDRFVIEIHLLADPLGELIDDDAKSRADASSTTALTLCRAVGSPRGCRWRQVLRFPDAALSRQHPGRRNARDKPGRVIPKRAVRDRTARTSLPVACRMPRRARPRSSRTAPLERDL